MDLLRIKIWLVCLIFAIPGFSQSQPDGIDYSILTGKSLNDALFYLTENYDVNFSYNPGAIAEIKVFDIPQSINTLPLFLEWVLYGTNMDFVFISNTYVLFPKSLGEKEMARIKTISVHGRIIDKNTREALPFASISVPTTALVATTNTDGKFTLLNIPSDTLYLHISYIGYMPIKFSLKNIGINPNLVIELVRQERFLPQVQVMAWRHEIIELGSKTGGSIFNPSQISNLPSLGEKDVFSALRKLPGIKGGVDASTGLQIWGGKSDQNLVLFDGITVYHVDHFYGFLSAFNTHMIKNIQLMKGGYTAKYGGRTSGVVNITGIDGNKINPGVVVETSSLSTNLGIELPLVPEKASLVLAFRRSFTDYFQSRGYKNLFNSIYNSSVPASSSPDIDVFDSNEIPDYRYSDLNAKIHFIPSHKDEVAFSFYRANDNLAMDFNAHAQSITRVASDLTHWGNTGGSIKWSRKWNANLFTYGNYGVSIYESSLNAEESYFLTGSDTLLSRIYHMQQNKIRDNTLRIDNTWEINSKTNMEFGFWNTQYSIKHQAQNQNQILQDTLGEKALSAGYLEFNRLFGKWSFSPGMRASAFDGEVFIEPRFSFSHEFKSKAVFNGSYGIFHQNIRRLNERSLYLSIPEIWVLTNKHEVPALQSTHYMLGLMYPLKDWLFNVEGYHKSETGTVDFLFPEFGIATGNLAEFSIGGSRKIWGFDALIKRNFKNQYVLLGYTFLNSKTKYADVNEGKAFRSSGAPAHEINLLYSYDFRRWDFSGAFVVSEGEVYTPVNGVEAVVQPNGDNEQVLILGNVNSKHLQTYYRLDIGANYTVPLKKSILQFGISVYNLLDKRSVKFIDYYKIPIPHEENYTVGRREVKSLGITPSVFIKFKI